jgi:hypothetical protein
MFDAQTIARLRAVLDEVCAGIPRQETAARTHVASKMLEAAARGDTSADRLKQVAQQALHALPVRRHPPDAAGGRRTVPAANGPIRPPS